MDRLLSIEVAALLLLVLISVFIRVGVLDSSAEDLGNEKPQSVQQPVPEQTGSQTQPSETQPPETQPPETQPPHQLTFSEDLVAAQDYFVYDFGEENLMAISGSLDDRVYPASVTKLFTAYVALQYLEADTVLKLGSEVYMVSADSSLAYLKNGQRISVAQLVEGMLLPSGNDAAYALAVAAARVKTGNTSMKTGEALDCFVDMMNDTARALGMTGTHFANPDGYHDPDHYTTCGDLITIGRLALENELICQYASTSEARVTFSNGDLAVWSNTNDLIDPQSQYYHEDAVGLKTGHTSAAGFCLLSAFRLEDGYILIGTFGCERPEERFTDTLSLYDLVVDVKSE